jgi:hypothetical protein
MKKLFESSQRKLGGIYKITNLLNNRFYIGSTNLFLARYNKHILMLKNNEHDPFLGKDKDLYYDGIYMKRFYLGKLQYHWASHDGLEDDNDY